MSQFKIPVTKRKDTTITIRCSLEEKEKIARKAEKEGQSISNYTLDTAMAGLERRKTQKKKIVWQMVEIQQIKNEMYQYLQSDQECDKQKVIDFLNKIAEKENELWEC